MKYNKNYTMLPHVVLNDNRLSSTDKLVFWAISSFAFGNKNTCDPDETTLAKMCGVSEKTIERAVTKLEKCGYIESTQRGNNKTNLYRILIDSDQTTGQTTDQTSMSTRSQSDQTTGQTTGQTTDQTSMSDPLLRTKKEEEGGETEQEKGEATPPGAVLELKDTQPDKEQPMINFPHDDIPSADSGDYDNQYLD